MVTLNSARISETESSAARLPVPNGYKRTEVGVIPEDWEVRTIGESMRLINGRAFKPEEWKELGLPIVRIQNLNNSDAPFNYCSGSVEEKHRIESGDLLFAWSGTKGTSFGPRIWRGPSAALNQHIFKVLPNQRKLTVGYALLVLRNVQEQIEKHAHGFKASFVHVKKSDLIGVQLPLPPTRPEQEAITTVLGDADALIESLEQLIAKKRHLKQGAMQELLTGNKRLPGFSDEWEPKKIGELLCYERPDSYLVTTTDYQEHTGIPVLTANKSFVLGHVDEDFGIYRNLPAVIFDDFTTDSKYVNFPFKVKSSAMKILRSKDSETNLRFVYGRMCLINFPVGEHKRYYISEYQHLEFPTPKPDEQAAIASILSDMDAEIVALEAKLAKAHQIKQGMMQELLTGRIRLV